MAPPATIASTVSDALRPLGVELMRSPITPVPRRRGTDGRPRCRKAGGLKPAPFGYERPRDLGAALAILGDAETSAKIIAGGQSLGPMLNLRLVEPELIIDITGSCRAHPGRASRRRARPRCLCYARRYRGWTDSGRHLRRHAGCRRQHRLSRGSQSWHTRRIFEPCRSFSPIGYPRSSALGCQIDTAKPREEGAWSR